MPYEQGTRLPGEAASKLGHLAVVQSPWVRALVRDFEDLTPVPEDPAKTIWTSFNPIGIEPLTKIWAVDGSFVTVQSPQTPPKEVSFVKTALFTVDRTKLAAIDPLHPHPLLLREIMRDSAVLHATVFPLKNVRNALGSNYDSVRHIVRDSLKTDEGGAFYETLKWLAYRQWSPSPTLSPEFNCPHCAELVPGLPVNADEANCPLCGKLMFLSDMIGFHLSMDEESAPEEVSSAYMLIMEHLMLLTAVRLLWQLSDRHALAETLFIKDGPLALRSQYSKLVAPIREFLQYAKDEGRPVHIIGQEKSGIFFNHLGSIARFAPPHEQEEPLAYAALSHDFVRREVYRTPDLANPYGFKTNWGEKLYVKSDPATFMVLNIPTGLYDRADTFPTATDLIGLPRILATIPSLISRKFEGALYPVELANGIASMSDYPSAKVLERFITRL